MAHVTLTRTTTGYATKDGRFTIERKQSSGGINQIKGWSPGGTYFELTDTAQRAVLNYSRQGAGRYVISDDKLWSLRDRIAYILDTEAKG